MTEPLPKIVPRSCPLPEGFPDVVVHASTEDPERSKKNPHVDELYEKAKRGGDTDAAIELAHIMVSPDKVSDLVSKYDKEKPVIIPVLGMEKDSINKIPLALAKEIGAQTGWDVQADVFQVRKEGRTGMGGTSRFTAQASFEGEIDPKRKFVLVDDHAAMGGTLRNLADHIMQQGGEVLAMSTMTAGRNGQKVAPSPKAINRLNQEYGQDAAKLHKEMFGLPEPEGERAIRDSKKLRPDSTLLTHGEACYLSGYEGGLDKFREDAHKDIAKIRAKSAVEKIAGSVQVAEGGMSSPNNTPKNEEKGATKGGGASK